MNLSTLDSNLKCIDEQFDFVNYGGCACVATMLSKALRHVYPIMRITTSGFKRGLFPDIDLCRGSNKSKTSYIKDGFSFKHVWVEIWRKGRWYALDSTGVHTRSDMYFKWGNPAKGSFSINEIERLSNTNSWNSTFNRLQLPEMQEFINETFQ